jgi:pre-mRNA-splicing factor 38A
VAWVRQLAVRLPSPSHWLLVAGYQLTFMDEYVDQLLTEERVCDIILPRIQKRSILEENAELGPRKSTLLDAMEGREEQARSRSRSRSRSGSHSQSGSPTSARGRSPAAGSGAGSRYVSRSRSRSRLGSDAGSRYVSRSRSRSRSGSPGVFRSRSRSISPDRMQTAE